MLKNIKIGFGAAFLLAFFLPSVPSVVSAQDLGDNGALATLFAQSGQTNFVEALPVIVPEKIEDATRAGAPQPGRSFTPVVEDQARVKAIMKLLSDICSGVHLPYSQDGATFGNKEGRLPAQPKGYYKEYTLLTGNAPHTVVIGGTTYQVAPDLSARGSERIIIGGGERIYFTPDHYAHFIELTVVN